ncbi:Bax inhibitor-1/YccA family protein [Nocardia stercoris]|uniref:Bax inhibitor-1/YccA family protein n=1 Tax=Nocardia stercoris TaxID=2483361 RepID=A0A3M2LBL1_9NOCA|nr:Bax inhibitor-1/YccA family protein [Nocardia stercoris]RMI34932.1 hypothetical protein EBN03_00760 [Nocardia stercoris]
MRTSSNPIFKNLPPQQGGYAGFGAAPAGYAPQGAGYAPQGYGQPYQTAPATRPMTIDDVVTRTGITLGVVTVAAIFSYVVTSSNHALSGLFALGGLVAFGMTFATMFAPRLQEKAAYVLTFAAFEGLFLGAISFLFANVRFGGSHGTGGVGGAGMIAQAVLGTFGVFFGMLVVYKTGAVRVTPRFTRIIIGALIGVVVLVIGNGIAMLFSDDGLGLRSGGPLSIVFSLVVIGIAAFSFLLDFDAADQMIRAGVPDKAAWRVAMGLTITLVWLYLEILRLLSYLQND